METKSRPSILIVDDDPSICDLLEAILEPLGTTHVATGGEAALQCARSLSPDIILLDVYLPDVNGIQVCRRLRDIERVAETPILFITGKSGVEFEQAAFDAGGSDFITKPLTPEIVYARINAHLQLKLARAEALASARLTVVETAIAGSPSAFLIEDPGGQILEANPACEPLLGYTAEEMRSLHVLDITPPEQREITQQAFDKMAKGELRQISRDKQYLHKSGKLVWVHLTAHSVFNSKGGVDFIVAQLTDISQAKALTEQLEEKHKQLQLFMDSMKDLVFVKDQQYRIVFGNSSFFGLYPGRQPADIIGTTTVEAFPEQEAREFLANDRKAFEEGESLVREVINARNTRTRVLETLKRRFEDREGNSFILGVARDVTESEELIEKLRSSNSDLEEFAYIASHDLRSPLNAIEKISRWIQEDLGDSIPEASQEHFRLMSTRIQRLQTLLDDLLSYARINKLTKELEPVNLGKTAQAIFDSLDKPDSFRLLCEDRVESLPRVPVELVLRNLIGNALKHRDRDDGTIKIELEETPTHQILRVSDDGPGIPEKFREKALEMFETLVSRDQMEGSGMGLALVRKVAHTLGGRIELKQNHPSGLRVQVSWLKNNISDET